MAGLFDGTPLEQPVTCAACGAVLAACTCPRNADGKIVRPQDQSIRVSREKRRNGKSVTLITGLDPVASHLDALLKQLKSACASGGTISDGRVELQGDHRERIVALLKEMGYSAKISGG